MSETEPRQRSAAGWYEYEGALRRWNGSKWLDEWLPLPAAAVTFGDRVTATFFGTLLTWAVIRIGAEFAPDFFFIPIKIVVGHT